MDAVLEDHATAVAPDLATLAVESAAAARKAGTVADGYVAVVTAEGAHAVTAAGFALAWMADMVEDAPATDAAAVQPHHLQMHTVGQASAAVWQAEPP